MKRFRRAWPGVVAVAVAAVIMPMLAHAPASADGTDAGPAVMSPTKGTSATPFTFTLPLGAACTGDSAVGGYTVTSYMVRSTVNPATLQFDPLGGPLPLALGASFSQPLYEVGSGSPFTAVQTANADTPGGPGVIIGIPQFDLSSAGFQPGDIPAGTYNVGIACIKGPPSATQADKFWNSQMTVVGSATNGGPAQLQFAKSPGFAPDAPTLNTAVGATGGQITATFTPGAISVPATTGYTVSATPQGGGSTITANGSGSPITVTGLTAGTIYDVRVKATNAIGDSAASNTIAASPTLAPRFDVSDVSVVEGSSGTKNAVFTVSLSEPRPATVSVKYATANGTAVAPGDYTAKALTTLSFTAGQTSKLVAVAIKPELFGEADETFDLVLSAPVGVIIGDGVGTATIVNDDPPPPTLTVGDIAVIEGDAGTKNAIFNFQLSGPHPATVSVKYATANGTAVAPGDYTAKTATALSFTAGQTAKTVAIPLKVDILDEPDETFDLVLSAPVGLVVNDPSATATIIDDDPPPPTASINDVVVTEGSSGTKNAVFTVTLSHAAKATTSVKYATANGTAVAPGDYTAKTPTALSFTAGQTVKAIAIPLKVDVLGELDEGFFVNLSAPVGMTIADGIGAATIINDDGPPREVTVGDVAIVEGSSGTKNLIFTIQLSAPAQGTVSLKYKTVNGTAVSPADYTGKALTTLSFAAGNTFKTVTIPIKGDLVDEGSGETFQLVLSDATAGLTIVDGTAVGTITDDD